MSNDISTMYISYFLYEVLTLTMMERMNYMSKSLCRDCIHNCTDHRNNICANHKGIWCNAEYGRVINKKVKGCKNYKKKGGEREC